MKAILCKRSSPSRIVASDCDGNRVIYQVDSCDQFEDAYDNAAGKLCQKMDWHGKLQKVWLGDGQRVYVWLNEHDKLTF